MNGGKKYKMRNERGCIKMKLLIGQEEEAVGGKEVA